MKWRNARVVAKEIGVVLQIHGMSLHQRQNSLPKTEQLLLKEKHLLSKHAEFDTHSFIVALKIETRCIHSQ